jgi:hypothetical protein
VAFAASLYVPKWLRARSDGVDMDDVAEGLHGVAAPFVVNGTAAGGRRAR